jgi:hypothetical protein
MHGGINNTCASRVLGQVHISTEEQINKQCFPWWNTRGSFVHSTRRVQLIELKLIIL